MIRSIEGRLKYISKSENTGQFSLFGGGLSIDFYSFTNTHWTNVLFMYLDLHKTKGDCVPALSLRNPLGRPLPPETSAHTQCFCALYSRPLHGTNEQQRHK